MISENQNLLSNSQWRSRVENHRQKLSPFVERFRYWRTYGLKHPVYDFLFSYYSFSTGQLLRWSPGINVELETCGSEQFEWPEHFKTVGNRASIDISLFPKRRTKFLTWAITYLENTSNRPPVFHCFGLHEWAMVYQTEARQHPQVPLRLTDRDISKLIEGNTLCCTHYDAYRFFSPTAAALNRQQLQRESVMEFDQPGCIHANMDLYKLGYKVAPFLSSDLLADLFLLARSAREIDMRASPYDLSQFEMEPIAIETKEGREIYIREQKQLFANAQQQREQLIAEYKSILVAVNST